MANVHMIATALLLFGLLCPCYQASMEDLKGPCALWEFRFLGSGFLGAVLVSSMLIACGPKSGETMVKRDLSQFECNARVVAYRVTGGFAAEEAGVRVECDGKNPRLTQWRLDEGERSEGVHPLSGEQFDTLWGNVDSTGWRQVDQDCENPNASDGDPVYHIEVADQALKVTLECAGKTLPFPYDRMVNELDLRAAGFGDQDGPAA